MGYRLIAAKRRKKLKNSSFAAFVLFRGHGSVFYLADSSVTCPISFWNAARELRDS